MKKETILYVDDEEINLELFKANFDDDYNVLLALSGHEGLELVKSNNKINIIVSDVKMPGMSGFEFIRRVKAIAPEKICIVLSAYAQTDLSDSSMVEKDIYRYLNKPWRRPEMSRVISDAIDSFRTPQEV
jgi:response regulator RpfG family c-di-GMP phosphodiesterase